MSVVKIKGYSRKIKGKRRKVKPHKRKNRKLGKNIKFKKVGTFLVAHDDMGNFRGSKVQLFNKNLVKKKKS